MIFLMITLFKRQQLRDNGHYKVEIWLLMCVAGFFRL